MNKDEFKDKLADKWCEEHQQHKDKCVKNLRVYGREELFCSRRQAWDAVKKKPLTQQGLKANK